MNEEFLTSQAPPSEDGIYRDPGLNMFVNAEWNKRSS
jgi:hypothetical protein